MLASSLSFYMLESVSFFDSNHRSFYVESSLS